MCVEGGACVRKFTVVLYGTGAVCGRRAGRAPIKAVKITMLKKFQDEPLRHVVCANTWNAG